ncbi:START domain-containing protein 10 [Sparganum proliferum]
MFALGEVREPTEGDFDHFRKFVADKDGWTIFYSRKKPGREVITSTKCSDLSPIKLIKVEAKLSDVPAASIYDCLHDAQYRKTWDYAMKEGIRVAYVSPNSEIGYYHPHRKQCSRSPAVETYAMKSDPKGNIPTFAVNVAAKLMAPKIMKRLLDAGRSYSRWKESNNPDFMPWRNFEQLKQFPLIEMDDISSNS